MDAATVGSNSFSHPLSDFLQEHAGSSTSILDTKDGKVDTVSKRFKKYGFTGLPLILLCRILSSHSQPRPEQKSWNNTDHRPPRGVSSRVSVYAFWRRNRSRLLAEVGSISPRHLQWRCAKSMQSWDFNCFFPTVVKSSSSRQSKIIQSNCQKDSDSFAASEVGRAAAYARMKFYHVAALCLSNSVIFGCISELVSVGSRAETCFSSDWCQAGASRECKDGRVWKGCACVHGRDQILKESPGCRIHEDTSSDTMSHQCHRLFGDAFPFSGRMVSPVLPRHEHSRTLQQPVPLQCCIHRQATAAPGMGAQVASLDEPIWVTS